MLNTDDQTLQVLDLFSGIGGFSLGLERAGMRTIAFCEIDDFCQKVLAKHWPKVPLFKNVTKLNARCLRGIRVDVICGGFPCQDISFAGKGAGIKGSRSGLWSEFARLIGEFRPRYVIVENVAALLVRGLDVVLGDLAALGFDAEWHCIPASAVGAPHRRDRIWIVAYPSGRGQPADGWAQGQGRHADFRSQDVANAAKKLNRSKLDDGNGQQYSESSRQSGRASLCEAAPNPNFKINKRRQNGLRRRGERSPEIGRAFWRGQNAGAYQWESEPNVGRVAHGVPFQLDRLGSLGNAVVPQIPEIIGRAIIADALHH